MKRTTLVTKLLEDLAKKPNAPITVGEISLALDILNKVKEQNPDIYKKLAPEIDGLVNQAI
jgi:hypothetical protein